MRVLLPVPAALTLLRAPAGVRFFDAEAAAIRPGERVSLPCRRAAPVQIYNSRAPATAGPAPNGSPPPPPPPPQGAVLPEKPVERDKDRRPVGEGQLDEDGEDVRECAVCVGSCRETLSFCQSALNEPVKCS